MSEIIEKRNRLAAEYTVKNLKSRGFEAAWVPDRAAALELALSWIPEGSSVGWGGSVSADEIGLRDAIRQGNYIAIDRDTARDPAERKQLMKRALTADTFIMGTNALSEDGQLVNIDGNGNRVAALCYGPDSVIVIAGINKLAHTLEDAVQRARTVAAPINAQRFAGESPCRRHGVCGNCHSESCICSQLLITRTSMTKGRIKVLLVGEALGF